MVTDEHDGRNTPSGWGDRNEFYEEEKIKIKTIEQERGRKEKRNGGREESKKRRERREREKRVERTLY